MKRLSKSWTLLLTLLLLSSASAVADNAWRREINFPIINPLPLIPEEEEEILTPLEVLNQLFNLVGQQYQVLLQEIRDAESGEDRNGIYNDYLDDLEDLLDLLPQGDNPSNINVNTPTDSETTLLGLAAERTNADVVEMIVNHGANLFHREPVTIEEREVNLTPLGIAREARNINTFTAILLRLHPESIIEGLTPLQHAVRSGLTNVTAELLDRNPELINAVPEARRIPLLHMAIRQNNEVMLDLLLENGRGADINLQDGETRRTPLQAAIAAGNTYAFNRLLQLGADVEAQDLDGNRALHFAVEAENPEFMTHLLATNGIEIHPINNNGHTPLHVAAEGNENAVRLLLLEEGINVNAETPDGMVELEVLAGTTPLHLAAENNHRNIVFRLLRAGGNPHARDCYNDTPAELAREWNHLELADEIDRYVLRDFKGSYIVTDHQNQILGDFRPEGERFADAFTQAVIAGLITLIATDIQSIQAQVDLK